MAVLKFSNPSLEMEKPKKEKIKKMATKTKPKKRIQSPKQKRWLAAVKRHGSPSIAKKYWDGEKGVDKSLSSSKVKKAKVTRIKKAKVTARKPAKKTGTKKKRVFKNPAPRYQKHSSISPGMVIAQDVAGGAAGFAVAEIVAALVKLMSKDTTGKYTTFSKLATTAGLFAVRKKISPNQRFANQICIGASINTLASAYNHFAPSHLSVLQKLNAVNQPVTYQTQQTTPDYSGWNAQAQTAIPSTEPGMSGIRGLGRIGQTKRPARVLNYLPAPKRVSSAGGMNVVRV